VKPPDVQLTRLAGELPGQRPHVDRARWTVHVRQPDAPAYGWSGGRVGATPWVERARAELRATGETTQSRGAAWDRLTVQELQIAQLAARGASNPEIAGQLFLSRRTIEYHLQRVPPTKGVHQAQPGLPDGVSKRQESGLVPSRMR
jgi:DNA-binding CsgD family transcriptional regulator